MNEYAWHYFNLAWTTHIDPWYVYVLLCSCSGNYKSFCRLSQIIQTHRCHYHPPTSASLWSSLLFFHFAVLLAIWIADIGTMHSDGRTAHHCFSCELQDSWTPAHIYQAPQNYIQTQPWTNLISSIQSHVNTCKPYNWAVYPGECGYFSLRMPH